MTTLGTSCGLAPLHEILQQTRGPCALLESTSSEGPLARRSILARGSRAVLRATRTTTEVSTPRGNYEVHGHPLDALRELLGTLPRGHWPEEAGVVGAVAYDLARPAEDPQTLMLAALAVDRLEVFERPPANSSPGRSDGHSPSARAGDLARWSSLSRGQHRRLVGRVKEHIAAGDIYQANLSQRFQLPFHRSGLELYGHLRDLSPAPFSGYLRLPGLEIVSASPERLLSVRDGIAQTRPIAGTRPRSADGQADQALEVELLLSEKERAEHLMLVDLARNDLGQTAALGSVHVDEFMTVEAYAHVRHIVSNVSARLAPGRDSIDALRALFPGGTITGVPKRRCMEILDELEPVPRGFYTGSLFYLTRSGRLDANILIRSAVVSDGRVTFHAGGGIVADSDPDHEYAETLHKAEGLRLAVEAALDAGP